MPNLVYPQKLTTLVDRFRFRFAEGRVQCGTTASDAPSTLR